MKLTSKLLLSFAFILVVGFSLFFSWVNSEVRKSYSALIEQSLVFESNFIAELLSNREQFEKYIPKVRQKDQSSSLSFYVTDKSGKVLYHSVKPDLIGADFSQWNDVYLTLRGSYGARSTRVDKDDPLSSVFYIAAPIVRKKEVVGVVSVFRPELSLNHIFERSRSKILMIFGFVISISFLLIMLSFRWIASPFEELKKYIENLIQKRDLVEPAVLSGEFKELANQIKNMKLQLDDRNKLEAYVQKLIHEVKSPLTAINASAEIIEDESTGQKEKLFALNIQTQSKRIKEMLNTLLEISRVQKMEFVDEQVDIDLKKLIQRELDHLQSSFERRGDTVNLEGAANVSGNDFLLSIALRNIFQNITVHSKSPSVINIDLAIESGSVIVRVENSGSEVPDFVLKNMFKRYFSHTPDSNQSRGSGLGLELTKEIIELHQGEIKASLEGDRLKITIELPVISNS